jgi:serine/threonine protein phosphatase PrpC
MVLNPRQESRLYLDQDMTEPEAVAIARGTAIAFSARAPDKERANEDAGAVHAVSKSAAVLVVADGVGGGPAGHRAAGLAVESVVGAVRRTSRGSTLRTAILDGFEQANRDILALGIGATTTMAAVEIQDGTVRPYHVGDSEILIVGQRGKVKLQTISHSPVGYALESGLLYADDALEHEDRHLVSNVLGTEGMRIELGPRVTLAPLDTLLLASDGLFDNLALEEIVELLRKGPLESVGSQLAAAARRRMLASDDGRGKPDDLTFIAFRLDRRDGAAWERPGEDELARDPRGHVGATRPVPERAEGARAKSP